MRKFISLKNFIGLVALGVLGSSFAIAETAQTVYLPLIFDSGQIIKTSACLQITEHTYPSTDWWDKEIDKVNINTPVNALKALVSASKNKNKDALFKLTELTQRSDEQRLYRDMEQFFKWRDRADQITVTKAYEFDNLVVFPVQIKQSDKIHYLVFGFIKNADGSLSFLPYGSEQLNYLIVSDFLSSKWGLTNIDGPEYCNKELINHATHRILLSTTVTKYLGSSLGYIYFRGATLNGSKIQNKLANRVQTIIKDIKVALNSPDRKEMDAYIKYLTPAGSKGLKEWLVSVNESQFESYKYSIINQQPIFFIDAYPLVVVYTKPQSGSLQEMFFVADANNNLLWTHSSHKTNSTKIFSSAPFREAALNEKPFVKH